MPTPSAERQTVWRGSALAFDAHGASLGQGDLDPIAAMEALEERLFCTG